MKSKRPHAAIVRILYECSAMFRLGYGLGRVDGRRDEIKSRPEFGRKVQEVVERRTAAFERSTSTLHALIDEYRDALLTARAKTAERERTIAALQASVREMGG